MLGQLLQPAATVSRPVLRAVAAAHLTVLFCAWSARPRVLPGPVEVAAAFLRLWQDGLGRELLTSLALNAEALLWTVALGLTVSYLGALPLFAPLRGAVSRGRFVGLAGLTLPFTLAFGGGRPLQVALLVAGTSVFFVTSMADVLQAVPREAWDHARTLRFSTGRAFLEVVVRGTAHQALDALRQNAAIGWLMLPMVEGLCRAQGGLGAVLLGQSRHLHLAEAFAVLGLVFVVGVAQDRLLLGLRRLLCPYAELTTLGRTA
jgi:NitT/TauT family transport system permease protein